MIIIPAHEQGINAEKKINKTFIAVVHAYQFP